MIDPRLLSAAQCPTATFLLDQTQISSPQFSEQLAALDHGSRAVVFDRRKEQVVVISRNGQEITDVLAQTDQWGWMRCDGARE